MRFCVKLDEQTYAQPVACYRKRLLFNIAASFTAYGVIIACWDASLWCAIALVMCRKNPATRCFGFS
ncbi:hypothetical protein ACVLVH_000895 [Kluyvera sp. 1366]|jgi:hypothetical protein